MDSEASEPMERLRILVVDDTAELNLLLCMMINKAKNMMATGVHSGLEAIEILNVEEFDLILLDVMMPEMSGFETLNQIRAKFQDLPVVMCTAKSERKDIEEAFLLGADDYLVKPVKKEALLKSICHIIDLNREHLEMGTEMTYREEQKTQLLSFLQNKEYQEVEERPVTFRPRIEGEVQGEKLSGWARGIDATGFRLKTGSTLDGVDEITFAVLKSPESKEILLVGIAAICRTGHEGPHQLFRARFLQVKKP